MAFLNFTPLPNAETAPRLGIEFAARKGQEISQRISYRVRAERNSYLRLETGEDISVLETWVSIERGAKSTESGIPIPGLLSYGKALSKESEQGISLRIFLDD